MAGGYYVKEKIEGEKETKVERKKACLQSGCSNPSLYKAETSQPSISVKLIPSFNLRTLNL